MYKLSINSIYNTKNNSFEDPTINREKDEYNFTKPTMQK